MRTLRTLGLSLLLLVAARPVAAQGIIGPWLATAGTAVTIVSPAANAHATYNINAYYYYGSQGDRMAKQHKDPSDRAHIWQQEPPPAPVEKAVTPREYPRHVHQIGGVSKIVQTHEECEEALDNGWYLLPPPEPPQDDE